MKFLSTFFFILVLLACCAHASEDLDRALESHFVSGGDFLSTRGSTCDSLAASLESSWCRVAPACLPDSVANAFLVPTRVDGTVTTFYNPISGIGHQFTATGFVLSASQGGPGGVLRGLVFIPEDNVEGGSYAPLVSRVARAGHFAVALSSITGLSDNDVLLLVERAIALRPDIGIWVLAGHGRGGNLAASIVSRDRLNGRFRGVVLYGAAPSSDFSAANMGVAFAYGGNDTVTTPSAARSFLASRAPPDTWALYFASAQHMDFAYSTCLNNSFTPGTGECSPLRFESAAIPVLSMPVADSGSKVRVNVGDEIIITGNPTAPAEVLGDSCKDENTEYSLDNGLTWNTVIDDHDLSEFLYVTGSGAEGLRVEARTQRNAYSTAVTQLQGALVRARFTCSRIATSGCVEFYVHSDGAAGVAEVRSRAVSLQGVGFAVLGTDSIITNIMGVSAWRAPNERALSFFNNAALSPANAFAFSKPYPASAVGEVMTETINVPSFNPNIPITRRWHVFRPINTTLVKGGLIYLPGGALDARAYGALAFEFAARGYVVVLPLVTLRISLLDVSGPAQFTLPTQIISNPAFAYVGTNRWAIGGHSLGGAAAATYGAAASNATFSRVRALILHAGAVSPPGVANTPLQVVQIYGQLDNLLTSKTLNPALVNPTRTRNVEIIGGNHYQVGDYNYQVPDNVAVISIEQQQTQTVEESVVTLVAAGLV